MNASTEQIITLLQQPELSTEEIAWLLDQADTNDGLREVLQEKLIVSLQEPVMEASPRAKELLSALHTQMESDTAYKTPVHRVHILRTAWFRYAAAILIVLGIGVLVYENKLKEEPSVTQKNPVPVQSDIAPGGDKAILTLADGNKLVLDSGKSGRIAQQGGAGITNENGHLVYTTINSVSTSPLSYNTLSTPKGGQYQLTLPDGTQVWLNAASSITYPVAFNGNKREVTVSGEVYLEVAKDKSKPFIVSCAPLSVEVLGTHFNVNAYSEEQTKNITLLEGSVRLTSHLSLLTGEKLNPKENSVLTSVILKPGQQGQLKDQRLSLAVSPDLEEVMAWKNGQFAFNGADVTSVMNQLKRWYDVEVVYDGPVPQANFHGTISRHENLMQVLKMLELTHEVKFRVTGRTITVTK